MALALQGRGLPVHHLVIEDMDDRERKRSPVFDGQWSCRFEDEEELSRRLMDICHFDSGWVERKRQQGLVTGDWVGLHPRRVDLAHNAFLLDSAWDQLVAEERHPPITLLVAEKGSAVHRQSLQSMQRAQGVRAHIVENSTHSIHSSNERGFIDRLLEIMQ